LKNYIVDLFCYHGIGFKKDFHLVLIAVVEHPLDFEADLFEVFVDAVISTL